MAFWSNPSLDPKRQFRFKVTFDSGSGIKPPVYIAQTADRPTYTIIAGTKVHFLDKEFKYPGKVTWQDIKIGFIDGTGNSTEKENMAKQVYEYLAAAGFIYPEALTNPAAFNIAVNLATIAKKKSILKQVEIEPLGTDGAVIEKYTLKNAFISSFTPSGFDYAQEGFSTLQLSIVYDWAEYA